MSKNRKQKVRLWGAVFAVFLCMCGLIQAAELGKVTMERGRWVEYPRFWGAHGTYFYTAHTNQGDYTAYCLEPDKNFVPPGEYEPELQPDNDGLRAALYYGYGGPGQGEYIDNSAYENLGECPLEDAKYVRTHLAVSYFFDKENAFHNMDEGDVQNSGVWEFIEWLQGREIPTVSSRFSKDVLTAYYEKGADYQRTESIQYLSENQENRISFTCPEGVILHNETTGEEKAGIVSVRAGESFYFSAPLDISVKAGEIWKSGKLQGEKDGRWEAVVLPSKGDAQTSGYGCFSAENTEPVEFQVQWTTLGDLEIQKTDAETQEAAPQGNGSLKGAVYSVFCDGQEAGTIETDEKGYGRLEKVKAGTYTIKETKAPAGYELDTETYTVTVPGKDGSTSVKILSKEQPIKVRIKLQKIDDETGKPLPQGNGVLKGAEYTVYAAENIGSMKKDSAVGIIVTDEQGKGTLENLLPGKYYIKETKASEKYFLDDTRYEVSFPLDGEKKEELITSREKPVRGLVELQKQDAETGEKKPQVTGAVFKGAVYGVYAQEDIGNMKKGEKVTEIVTDSKGYGKAENLFCGAYLVKELSAPEGYLTDEKEYKVVIPEAEEGSTQLKILINSKEKPIRGDVSITKFLKEEQEDSSFKKPGEGISFTFTEKGNEKNQVIITTDKNGYASTKDKKYTEGRLLYGTYEVKESNVPEGYTPVAPFEITIKEKHQTLYYILENDAILCPVKVVKTAADTGKVIAKQGARFKIQKKTEKGWEDQEFLVSMYPQETRQTIFETDESGSFHLPQKLKAGQYRVVEVEPPKGYALNPVPVEFTIKNGMDQGKNLEILFADKPQQGKIRLVKRDGDTGEVLGAGFVFSVIAGEDIYTGDKTLRMKKGEEAARITTGEDGTAETGLLYPGKYLVKEEQAGEYYAESRKIYEAKVEAESKEEIFLTELEADNKKTRVEIVKTEAGEKEKFLKGTEFTLYREEQLTKEQITGSQELPQEGEQVLITDEKGLCDAVNLKHNTVYYLAETKAPEGYARSKELYKFAVDEKGYIEGQDTFRVELENYPITLEISKKGQEENTELQGAELVLTEEDGTKKESWTTKEKPHVIKYLKPGNYILREEKAPKGYKTAAEMRLEIKDTPEIQKEEMKDEYLKGNLQITKKDKENKETLGAGFVFVLTAAEDICTPEGKTVWKKGDFVQEFSTDESGIACARDLFPGKYQVYEKISGEYYAVEQEKYDAVIQITKENTGKDCALTIYNEKTKLMLEKTDSVKKAPMEQVEFAFAEADRTQKEMSREEVLEKGIRRTTDKEGKICLSELKHGKAYFLTEVKTREGYILDKTVYRAEVDEQGLINKEKRKVLKLENKPAVAKEQPKTEKPKPEKTKTVKTEDESRSVLFLLLGAGGAGVFLAAAKGRKKKDSSNRKH